MKTPVGDYRSALAFLCYSVGLNAAQTVARFNERVFARLGYFANSLWTISERNLLDSGRNTGLPVERYFRSWVRRGCFMYSVNHPKLFVLADLAAGSVLDKDAPIPRAIEPPELGRVVELPEVGGLHHRYERCAA